MYLKAFIQNLVQIGTVVSEKIQFEFLYVHDLGPRSRNDLDLLTYPLWNNSLISISILRDYWLVTMRDGHKRLLIYLDFPPEAWGWFALIVCFYGAKVSIFI